MIHHLFESNLFLLSLECLDFILLCENAICLIDPAQAFVELSVVHTVVDSLLSGVRQTD